MWDARISKGEPIVETPRDAVVCFLTAGTDHLILQGSLISKTHCTGLSGHRSAFTPTSRRW
jgi:hypothetical protein